MIWNKTSHVVDDKTSNLKQATKKIKWAKFLLLIRAYILCYSFTFFFKNSIMISI